MPEYFERGPMEIRKEQIERDLERGITPMNTPKPLDEIYTHDELHAAAWGMQKDGSFAQTISDAYFIADKHNKKKLLREFADLFLRHLEHRQGS